MAKLQLKTAGLEQRELELKLGINRFGRAPESDVCLEHPTVSGTHCEVSLGCGQVLVRDCGSTNGTFVDGTPVETATLLRGQTLRLGDLEFLVADTEIPISIPKFTAPVEAHPTILPDAGISCRRHQASVATYQCTKCHELLCGDCIHRLRRRGGNLLCLCPFCSYPVIAIGGEKKKKKSLLRRLRDTTRLLFSRTVSKNRDSSQASNRSGRSIG